MDVFRKRTGMNANGHELLYKEEVFKITGFRLGLILNFKHAKRESYADRRTVPRALQESVRATRLTTVSGLNSAGRVKTLPVAAIRRNRDRAKVSTADLFVFSTERMSRCGGVLS